MSDMHMQITPPKRRTVLVVDDEQLNRELLGTLLEDDYRVLYASNGQEALALAKVSAEVTHDHPEGIKGAEATASAIFLARTGKPKAEIKAYIEETFGYDLSRTCDQIRPNYHHVESCQETVPEAITAFLEGESFEDVIRAAVSLGGDCDTVAAIAGSIAEGFYDIPEELKHICRNQLPVEFRQLLDQFINCISIPI